MHACRRAADEPACRSPVHRGRGDAPRARKPPCRSDARDFSPKVTPATSRKNMGLASLLVAFTGGVYYVSMNKLKQVRGTRA